MDCYETMISTVTVFGYSPIEIRKERAVAQAKRLAERIFSELSSQRLGLSSQWQSLLYTQSSSYSCLSSDCKTVMKDTLKLKLKHMQEPLRGRR